MNLLQISNSLLLKMTFLTSCRKNMCLMFGANPHPIPLLCASVQVGLQREENVEELLKDLSAVL